VRIRRMTSARTANIEINTNALTSPGCSGEGLAAILLHEMVHAYGQDPGAPNLDYHNQTDSGFRDGFTHLIDCRDRVYGCMESCFPGSTRDKHLGNPEACKLAPSAVFPGGPGCNSFCPDVGGGLRICSTKSSCTDPNDRNTCHPIP